MNQVETQPEPPLTGRVAVTLDDLPPMMRTKLAAVPTEELIQLALELHRVPELLPQLQFVLLQELELRWLRLSVAIETLSRMLSEETTRVH